MRNLRVLKEKFLFVAKYLGLFYLARIVTRRGLRILCYHGFSVTDEAEFGPETFMEPNTFKLHMDLLVSKRYPVISLTESLQLIAKRALPPCPVVITFDDGFKTIKKYVLTLLCQYNWPITIFLTTYYCVKENPVFRLVVQYMFWKTSRQEVDLTSMGFPIAGSRPIKSIEARHKLTWQLINYAEQDLNEDQRQRVAVELGIRLGVSYEEIVERGSFSIMDTWEIRQLAAVGGKADFQLHTHRHNFPENEIVASQEIKENRSVLEPILGKSLVHFCYPSGVWSESHFQILKESSIESAVTCDAGLNYPDTPRFALKRFLDGQNISDIVFEAELSGFIEIIRKTKFSAQALVRRFKPENVK